MKDYLEHFSNFNHFGANIVDAIGILERIAQGAAITIAHKNKAQEQYYPAALIMGTDRS